MRYFARRTPVPFWTLSARSPRCWRLEKIVENNVVSAAEAMPADKYGFVPAAGEFKGVRTFAQQLKHLAATNYILAAAAMGQDPPAGAGDETGPEAVRTKAEVMEYVRSSFANLQKAIAAIDDRIAPVKPSPISPLQGASATRLALTVEALIHAYDHYGQMVEYLRIEWRGPTGKSGVNAPAFAKTWRAHSCVAHRDPSRCLPAHA